jgi:GNAT superfamily N-acetyltransferase
MIDVKTSTTAADDARSNEIYNAVCPRYAHSTEDARSFKQTMRAADDHLALLDGELAGSAFTAIRPDRPDVAFGLVTVPEEHRRRGVGSALYDTVSRWAARHDLSVIEGIVEEDDAAGRAFVERRGFEATERYERMVLVLASARKLAVAAPDGVEIARWREDDGLAREIYEVAVEAYPDTIGAEDDVLEPYGDWLDNDLRRLDKTGATFIALAEGQVVGYAQLTTTGARPGVGAHAFTAVKRAWRSRGVAGALKRAAIEWAKASGLRQLVTQNEERNVPILRLNERLGYRPESARLFVRGPLSPGA